MGVRQQCRPAEEPTEPRVTHTVAFEWERTEMSLSRESENKWGNVHEEGKIGGLAVL